MRVATPSPPLIKPGGIALLDFEKAEAIADSLAVQFQIVNNSSEPAVIEMFGVALRAYSFASGSEPKLTNPAETQDEIRVSRPVQHQAHTV